ncbi:MAG: hypothetical protein CL878_04170 [Dehalococcoidia bacterium]|nr:hypothetical protein [Dehalococcoidia bacterium]
MTVAITGLGYFGSLLAQRLLSAGNRVVALENGFATDAAAAASLGQQPGCNVIEGSVCDLDTVEALFADEQVQCVVHLAAQASAHPDAASPAYTEEVNLRGPRIVLDAMIRHSVPRMVYASSFRLYGRALAGTITEDTPPGEQSDLSHLSKLYAEHLQAMYARSHDLTTISLRFGLAYGLSPVMKTDPRFMTAPNLFCLQAVHGEPLHLHETARQATALVHVDDAVRLLAAAADRPLASGHHVYNAAAEVASVGEVARSVQRAGQRRGLAVRLAGPGTVDDSSLSPFTLSSRLSEWEWRWRWTLMQGIEEVLDYFAATAHST